MNDVSNERAPKSDDSIQRFFTPRHVAVVGASSDERSVGHAVLRNLLFGSAHGPTDRARGFQGGVHAVNRRGGQILGHPVHETLASIGEPLDLAVIAIPGRFIPDLMDEVADAGARAAIVISAGFAEMGDEGRALQARMVERARARGVRVIGPNCLGVIRPSAGLNASFAPSTPRTGRIAMLSQSGALITGLLSYAERERIGVSAAVSLGAKADVDDVEILDWLADDDETSAIAIYVEAFEEPRRAFEALARVARVKPVVAIKGGATAAGARAASSHTGALAGSAGAYRAAFLQAGAQVATTIDDFLAAVRALATQPPARGPRVAIVTNAGGPGVLSADEATRVGLELAELSDETRRGLDAVLPSVWSHGNPIDVIGDATPERYRDTLNVLGRAPEVDGLVVVMTVQAMTEPQRTAEAIAAAHADPTWSKPLIGSFLGLVGTETGSHLDACGIPELNTPEEAVRAMAALVARGRWTNRALAPAATLEQHPAPDLEAARALVHEAQAAGQRNLDLARARQVLEKAGLRYNRSGTARDADEAARVAADIGFPVVVKLISEDVVHKSDAGGVVLNVKDADGVSAACARIRRQVESHQPGARIDGFTIEEQVSGTELIVGVSRDPGFGPIVMVGLGGIFVEVLKDVSFRLIPLGREDALEMIDEIRAQPLLDGARKRPRLDRAELAGLCLRISELVTACPEIEELDVNPFVITDHGLVAIDARVIVRPADHP